MQYEMVAGLETHIELSTHSKLFCDCSTTFGAPPNSQCCPVCTGQPGTLPRLNAAAVQRAALAGLALGCTISSESQFVRKNYIYPDLPKAYQTTQLDHPICYNGSLTLSSGKVIRIARIQLEEDAGKLIHLHDHTRIDYNRAGIPLIEIVTQPDFSTPAELVEYMDTLILMMRQVGVSDCKMQEGQLRCDVNISVCPTGSKELGERTEIKNVNSLAYIEKAAHYEWTRQADLLAGGKTLVQETRRFDERTFETHPMRVKEGARDYRFFNDPDLPVLSISSAQLEQLRASLPELPSDKKLRFSQSFEISKNDACLLVRYPRAAAYFEETAIGLSQPVTSARLILGQMFNRLATENEKQAFAAVPPAKVLHALLMMHENGKITKSVMKSLLDRLLDAPQTPLADLLRPDEMGTLDRDALQIACRAAIEHLPAAAQDFRAGKVQAIGPLLGQVMQQTARRADAKQARAMIMELLEE